MKNSRIKPIIIGVLLILFGGAWLGNAVGLWNIDIFFPGWWAALLMLCFLFSILNDGANIVNVFLLLLFGALVLRYNQLIPTSVNLWLVALAVLVMMIGGKFLLRGVRDEKKAGAACVQDGDGSAKEEVHYTFAGETVRFAGQTVSSCNYGVSFGSLTLDFTGADFAENAEVFCSVEFGEGKILLPAGVRAVLPSPRSSFGSIKNESTGTHEVTLSVSCNFGSVLIRNV